MNDDQASTPPPAPDDLSWPGDLPPPARAPILYWVGKLLEAPQANPTRKDRRFQNAVARRRRARKLANQQRRSMR